MFSFCKIGKQIILMFFLEKNHNFGKYDLLDYCTGKKCSSGYHHITLRALHYYIIWYPA